ncbi:hypothetical protein EJB05_13705, partial [Eragrostis curvula]
MAARLLGLQGVGASKWVVAKLSKKQGRYACTDAYISWRLGVHLRGGAGKASSREESDDGGVFHHATPIASTSSPTILAQVPLKLSPSASSARPPIKLNNAAVRAVPLLGDGGTVEGANPLPWWCGTTTGANGQTRSAALLLASFPSLAPLPTSSTSISARPAWPLDNAAHRCLGLRAAHVASAARWCAGWSATTWRVGLWWCVEDPVGGDGDLAAGIGSGGGGGNVRAWRCSAGDALMLLERKKDWVV